MGEGLIMQIDITFVAHEDKLLLPLPYNQVVQGFIYNHLDYALSSWLHDEAYEYKRRRYKLFVFGRLTGKYIIHEKMIEFQGPTSLAVRTINNDVLSSFAQHLLKKREIILGKTPCTISNISLTPDPDIDFSKPIRLRALSPVTVYSTLRTFDGRKKTYYYSPMESDWEKQILKNLIRKSQAINELKDNHLPADVWIRPKNVKTSNMKVLTFKDTIIKGWMGIYEVFLPKEFFWLGYNGGFGAKNSQGFGMMEVIGNA